jgi:hypothetical protein
MKIKSGGEPRLSIRKTNDEITECFDEMKTRYEVLKDNFDYLRHEKNGKIKDNGNGNGHIHSRRIAFADEISKLEPNGHEEWDIVKVRKVGNGWKYKKIVDWESPLPVA